MWSAFAGVTGETGESRLFRGARALAYLTTLAWLLVTPSTLFPFVVGKFAWFRGCVGLAWALLLAGLVTSPAQRADALRERLRSAITAPLGLALGVFALAVLAACAFGLDPSWSFWANFERGEGGLQILSFYLFFLLLAVLIEQERQWIFLFRCLCAVALASVGYGLLAALGVPGVTGGRLGDPDFRFSGAMGNPAFFAAQMLFAIFFALYAACARLDGRLRFPADAVWSLVCGLFLATLLWAKTRGAFVGLAAGYLVFSTSLALLRRRWPRRLLISGAVGLVILIALVALRSQPFVQRLPFARILDLSPSTESFTFRESLWRTAWRGFLGRPMLGLGPENVVLAHERHYDPALFHPPQFAGGFPDRAHDLMLDYLVTVGVVGTAAFLAPLVLLCWLTIRRSPDRPAQRALVLGIVAAYVVQGLVLFDGLFTYLPLAVLFARAQGAAARPPDSPGAGARGGPGLRFRRAIDLAGIPLALALVGLLTVAGAVLPFAKAALTESALISMKRGDSLPEMRRRIDRALSFPSPVGSEETAAKLVHALAAMTDGRRAPVESIRELASVIEPEVPPGAPQWVELASFYRSLATLTSEREDHDRAVDYFLRARRVAPGMPDVLYPLFELYFLGKDIPGLHDVGPEILSRWPGDAVVQQIMNAVR